MLTSVFREGAIREGQAAGGCRGDQNSSTG
jgi:hypothetical protein